MELKFLYDTLKNEFGKRGITSTKIPNYIVDNLKYEIRPYQTESFQRYILCHNKDFVDKPSKPYHLLYNMATGSGKTLVMAGLMLYLYEKGYSNFLFFVNSNNIIKKTKDNFLNPQASKYLFSEKIKFDEKEVLIKEVDNFEEADKQNINIKFTTIQQLHLDLKNTKENSVTYEDLVGEQIVLIADEAHHLSSSTKNNEESLGSWEGTVMKILKQNDHNILLEFTATLDYKIQEIIKKYQEKVIYKYDLAQFRLDKYSKEINLIHSQYDEQERIIQALILNLYRQELAILNKINLKPVILFKAKRTIAESEKNKNNFHQLIATLSSKMVDNIRETSTITIVQKAFIFFESIKLSLNEIVKRIQFNFKEENCISANNDEETESNQISLNTLEDDNNPIRAIFAVQKLNEGWDVLNLFDIVRLYEGQNTGGSSKTIGKTTLSEAQLIGRGARYFPFALEGQDQDQYKNYNRKYDEDISNDLKVLEELYYHTKEDSRYISELKKALIESGIYEDEDKLETKQLTLKPDFKKTDFYQTGIVFYNKKEKKNYDNINSLADLGVSKRNIPFGLSSGIGQMSSVFEGEEKDDIMARTKQKDIAISIIPEHIIRYALSQNTFFYFDNLERYFPSVKSLSNFIKNKDYLGGLKITFTGSKSRFANISNCDYLLAVQSLIQAIEFEIKPNLTKYEGSQYFNKPICQVFQDKDIRVPKDSERSKGQEQFVANKPWYVYKENYGTNEEKAFVKLFDRCFENLKRTFENIYLIRNERAIKIVDKLGRAFEPDFLFFCKQEKAEKLIYQVFIEPKGAHLEEHDKWKEDFLKEIRADGKISAIGSDQYLITGVPFYNTENENEFKKELTDVLKKHNNKPKQS